LTLLWLFLKKREQKINVSTYIKMVFCQMYLTATTQSVDLNLPAGYYKISLVGANLLYSAADASRFSIQFRSPFTMVKYGNARYLQIANPATHWYQIDGVKEWEYYYNGAFQMELIDLSTGAAPAGARFQEATLYFDIEAIKPTTQFKLE
jgi:hypothetical protein